MARNNFPDNLDSIRLPTGDEDVPLGAVRGDLRQQVEAGDSIICPCCRGPVKIYARSMSNGHITQLKDLWKRTKEHPTPGGWLPTKKAHGNRDWTLLKHWGLIERRDRRTATENASGYWRVLKKGLDFLQGHIKAPRYIFLFRDELLGFSDQMVDVKFVMGVNFNYQEVLGNYRDVPVDDFDPPEQANNDGGSTDLMDFMSGIEE